MRSGLAEVVIDVSEAEPAAIAFELVSGGDPRELHERIAKTSQELADTIQIMFKYREVHPT